MHKKFQALTLGSTVALLSFPIAGQQLKGSKFSGPIGESTRTGHAVLWKQPSDITSRNLFYGNGGEKHQPHPPFTFVKEDLKGTNPKFVVRDRDDVKWKIKLGPEAQPETVAARLVWAVGYSTDELYFLPEVRVDGMPARVHRGAKLVGPGGVMRNARLEREHGEKKVDEWHWRQNPFTGTRELNGLRVMMAVINNWDLKDVNNGVLEKKHPKDSERQEDVYLVGDLGASFGTTGRALRQQVAKGNLNSYSHSKFITKVTPDYVNFMTPSRPAFAFLFLRPREYVWRSRFLWIGHNVPRQDAKWTGQLLAKLSPNQIRDAFRAGGYTPRQVEGFSAVLQERIAELNKL
jgi:hypothetical protein